jgi:hypothetical protein
MNWRSILPKKHRTRPGHGRKPMNADISESKNAATGARRPKTPVIVLAATMSALAIYAIVSAPAMWRSAERFRAELSQQEDRAYCAKFRMPPGGESFAICAADLAEIRRLHGNRLAAEAAGTF